MAREQPPAREQDDPQELEPLDRPVQAPPRASSREPRLEPDVALAEAPRLEPDAALAEAPGLEMVAAVVSAEAPVLELRLLK